MRVVLKRVGKEPELVEIDIDNRDFGAYDEVRKLIGAKYIDKMGIGMGSGLYLFVGELAEGANFNIKTNNPYFPVQTIMGDCALVRCLNDEGWAVFGDMTENELELMKALVEMNDIKVAEYTNKSIENLTQEEIDLLEEELNIQRQMMNMLMGFGR